MTARQNEAKMRTRARTTPIAFFGQFFFCLPIFSLQVVVVDVVVVKYFVYFFSVHLATKCPLHTTSTDVKPSHNYSIIISFIDTTERERERQSKNVHKNSKQMANALCALRKPSGSAVCLCVCVLNALDSQNINNKKKTKFTKTKILASTEPT